MAAAATGPLLVVHDANEGYLVHGLRLESEETLELRAVPLPGVPPLRYLPLAVSGGTILGAPASQLPDTHGRPVMLPVGSDAVVRLDTVIHADSVFEVLRLMPGGGGWRTFPLPRPPVSANAYISSYLAVGTRVWVSEDGGDTFSLDTAAPQPAPWLVEMVHEMPFEGRGLFMPELGTVVGLTVEGGRRQLFSYRVAGGGDVQFSARTEWNGIAAPWECVDAGHEPSEEKAKVGLAHLGGGRFCVCRGVEVVMEREWDDDEVLRPARWHEACSLLVMEGTRLPDGYLDVPGRGRLSYIGMWPRGQCREFYFID